MTSTEPMTWIRITTGYYRSAGDKYTIKQDQRPGVTFWSLRYASTLIRSNFDTMKDAKQAAETHKAERS
jgi:hypothetical protein